MSNPFLATLRNAVALVFVFVTQAAGTNAQQPSPPTAAGMRLTFSETFDKPLSWCSERCAGQRWRTKYFHSGDTPLSRGLGMNGSETEIFMDPAYLGLGINPFHIENGTMSLVIEPASARVKAAVMAAWPSSYKGAKVEPRFTAGMLSTEKSFRQRYGYFEARIKVPNVPGTWPAFWLLGQPGTYDEVDVMELLGAQPTSQHLGHIWGVDGAKKYSEGKSLDGPDLSEALHTYGLLWTSETMAYYRDNVEVARFVNPGLFRPMYLIISMGTDGDWNKQQGFTTKLDAHAKMIVEYVRAYALD